MPRRVVDDFKIGDRVESTSRYTAGLRGRIVERGRLLWYAVWIVELDTPNGLPRRERFHFRDLRRVDDDTCPDDA